MLTNYGIHNAATRIEDKENDLFNIECPFIAHFGGDFVVVEKVESRENGKVHFVRNGKKISSLVSQFLQSWSGVILLTKTTPDSGEPDYSEHRKKDWLIIAQKSIIGLEGILLLGVAYIYNNVYANLGSTLLLFVNLLGIYICYLLVLKQMHIQSRYVDKICTLFSQSDCNNLLESDAAKLLGIFGWSEIGLGYFVSNAIILLLLPDLLSYLVIFNILTLPFTIWSVWYQKTKAHQWCPLCLIVLILLWTILIINLVFGYIHQLVIASFDPQSYFQFVLAGCIYTIPIFTLNLLLPKLTEVNQVEQLRQEINSVKANEDVFKTLLTQQPYYEVITSDSQILFCNPDAKLKISILTNPFCNPCAKMHARVETLLKETKEKICIQYIFSSFSEDLNYANRYFNAIYLEKGSAVAWHLYTDWFEKGKALKEAFFKDLHLDMDNPSIETEFQKHESWKEKTKLHATPTIVVNGYKLPENYKIEDLRYFTEFDVYIK
jgi:protein-disulfide isomerase